MKPFIINGQLWKVVRVNSNDPHLVDRTGTLRIATADPVSRTISISENILPPLLDQVIIHEIAHAVTMSYELLDDLHEVILPNQWVPVEEWAVSLLENYGIETIALASESLGRPVCTRGYCNG